MWITAYVEVYLNKILSLWHLVFAHIDTKDLAGYITILDPISKLCERSISQADHDQLESGGNLWR